jgi:K+-transporting ATPase ATPase A chain
MAIIAVFLAGLMVGRTPEYLGKKLGRREVTASAISILAMPTVLLLGAGAAIMLSSTPGFMANDGSHGWSEVLYAYASASNNNGSAFGGLSANTPFWNILLAVCMFLARFPLAIAMLAMAGSLAAKRHVPPSAGTLRTHTPLFVVLLACIVVVVGALTFLPALALGPIAEHLQAAAGH